MLSIALAAAVITAQDSGFVHSKTDQYTKNKIGGFTVLVSPAATADKKLLGPAMEVIKSKIEEINRIVPEDKLEHLHTVKIWIEHSNPGNRGAVYHPSAGWLKNNGYNTDKAKSVEMGNLRNLVSWTNDVQPMMLLHEMAHAYHHQVLTYQHKGAKDAYDAAMESGKYQRILHVVGRKQKHYGTNNVMEYFAEATEAYFGFNDFYPFNRAQLKTHDLLMYRVMEDVWGRPRGQSLVLGERASGEVKKLLGRT
jgi:hypothetical protein